MSTNWFLEHVATDGSRLTLAIHTLPFRVGRAPGAELSINARGLSRLHAELRADDSGVLHLHDLDSTNGTWVNRERVQGVRVLAENDLIHFGNATYRLGRAPDADADAPERALREALRGELLSATAEPIVQAQGGQVHAHELRGRCTQPALGAVGALSAAQAPLFEWARALGPEAALGEAFRHHGSTRIAPQLHSAWLFLDTQPQEIFTERFFTSLQALRALPAPPRLVVQVQEAATVQVQRMQALAARLAPLDVRLAHADFSADRAQLDALGEVPPHYVKFASSLVRGLHEAPASRQKQVRDLVKLVLDLDAVPLAAGVATEAEAALCRDLGFQLIQGDWLGGPVPVAVTVGS